MMDVRSLGWKTDLALLAHSGSSVDDRGDHIVVRTPVNPNFWWGNFVLVDHVPSPSQSDRWLEVFTVAFPEAGHTAIGFDVAAGDREELSWFAERGFETQADAVMTGHELIPPPAPTSDAVIRALFSDDDWTQSVDLRLRVNEQAGDEGYTVYNTRRVGAYRRMAERGRGACFGAFLDSRLVAQLGIFATGPGRARYQTVETHPDHRRRGLAGALVHHAATWSRDQLAPDELVIVADPEYVAIDLYRKLGFAPSEVQLRAQKSPRPTTL